MLVCSLALVLAPVPTLPLSPKATSKLKDAMAKLDGALKSLDTDSVAHAVNIMRAASVQSTTLQPAPEPMVLLPLQQPPAAAAVQSWEAPLRAAWTVSSATALGASETVPASNATTEWNEWAAQRDEEEEADVSEGEMADRWRTDGELLPSPVPLAEVRPAPIPAPIKEKRRSVLEPAADSKARLGGANETVPASNATTEWNEWAAQRDEEEEAGVSEGEVRGGGPVEDRW